MKLAMVKLGRMDHTFGMSAVTLVLLSKMAPLQMKNQKVMVKLLLVKTTQTFIQTALKWSMADHVTTETGETELPTGASAVTLV